MNLLRRGLYEIMRFWDVLGDTKENYPAEDITYCYVIGNELAKEIPNKVIIRRHLNALSKNDSPLYTQVRDEYLSRFEK